MFRSSCLAALLLALVSSLPAQPDVPTGLTVEVTPKDYVYRFSAEGVPLADVVKVAAEAAKRPILVVNQRVLEGKMTHLKGAVRVAHDEAWRFWQALFVAHGFAVVEEPGTAGVLRLEPIDSSRTLKQSAEFVHCEDVPALRNQAGRVIMTSIPLQHVEVSNARQAVSQLLTNRQAEFTQEVASANALIVVGFCPTVNAVLQLVRAMDVPYVRIDPEVAAIRLRYAVATEARRVVMQLMGMGDAGRGPGRVPPGAMASRAMLTVAADQRTNALIVSGNQETVERIRAVVELLDVEAASADATSDATSSEPDPKTRGQSGGSAKEFETALTELARFREEHGIVDFHAQASARAEDVERWRRRLQSVRTVKSDWEGPVGVDGLEFPSRGDAIESLEASHERAQARFVEFQKLWAGHERLTARLERARARYIRQ